MCNFAMFALAYPAPYYLLWTVPAELTIQTETLRARCLSQESAVAELAAAKAELADRDSQMQSLEEQLQMAKQVAK
jgi:hypothetical protein